MIWIAHRSNLVNGIISKEYPDVAIAEQSLRHGAIDKYAIIQAGASHAEMEEALRERPILIHQPAMRNCRCGQANCQSQEVTR